MDNDSYERNVRYWSQLFEDVVRNSDAKDWQPWLNTSYSNYVSGDDEIVIFSLYSPTKAKGLSVQQCLDLPIGRPCVEMLTRIAHRESGHPIKHLVINCSRDPVTELLVREAAKLWLFSEIEYFFCSTETANASNARPEPPK